MSVSMKIEKILQCFERNCWPRTLKVLFYVRFGYLQLIFTSLAMPTDALLWSREKWRVLSQIVYLSDKYFWSWVPVALAVTALNGVTVSWKVEWLLDLQSGVVTLKESPVTYPCLPNSHLMPWACHGVWVGGGILWTSLDHLEFIRINCSFAIC